MSLTNNEPVILIVDDNQDNLQILSNMLRMEGWNVVAAINGTMAIKQIQDLLPDLILLDIMMPDIDGYQTCQKIRANPNYVDIPLIFITALSEQKQKMKGFALGAVDYITKPFYQEEVLARVKVHLKLRQLTKTLAQQNKMLKNALEKEQKLNALKSQFVTTASHEFRTPLASILSSSELLEHYSHQWTEAKKLKHLHRIQTSVKHMTELLNDVLLAGKAGEGKLKLNPSKLNLPQFCQELVEEIQLTTQTHQIILQIINNLDQSDSYEPDLGTTENESAAVYMDEKILRYILHNLLSNGIKYSPHSNQIIFDLICQSKQAIFRVQDFGIGIPPAEQARLFDSFHRANNVGSIPGTGLGLTIVKKAIDLYGGKIAIESQVDRGTTFTVIIPYLVMK